MYIFTVVMNLSCIVGDYERLLSPRRKAGALRDSAVLLFACANYANYAHLVVRPSVANAYLSGNSAGGRERPQRCCTHMDHGCPRCFLPRDKLHPREIYASDGGLIVAP